MSDSPQFGTKAEALAYAERRSREQLREARSLEDLENQRDLVGGDGVDHFTLPLSQLEIQVLSNGIRLWTGSAVSLDARRAELIGFADIDEYEGSYERIATSIEKGHALSIVDWRRALRSTELLFISWADGLAYEWSMFSNVSDEATILVIRALQTKIYVWLGQHAD